MSDGDVLASPRQEPRVALAQPAPASRWVRALKLGLAPSIYLAAVVGDYLAYPWPRFVEWVGFLNGYLVLPFGRELTIPLMIARGFSPAEAVFLVVLVDFIAASFLAWNLDLSRKLAYVGPFVVRVERRAAAFATDHPSVRALGVAGLFLWSVKPGRGSGGATSAVLGKGVFVETWWLLPTITAGSLVGCTLVAWAAVSALSLSAPLLTLFTVALLAGLAGLSLWNARASIGHRLGMTERAPVTGDDK